MQSYCSIDWLSVTTRHGRGALSPKSLCENFIEKNGRMGYRTCYLYSSGVTHLWSEDRPEHHIIYSGKTLSNVVEIMPIQELVQFHVDLGHRVTRIDTAVDVFDSKSTVQEFADDWKNNRVVTRAKSGLLISDPKGESGDTFYLGSLKKRRKLLRVYDKAKEQKIDKDWLRLEMQYGQGAARSSAKQIADTECVEQTILGQLTGFAKFQVSAYREVVKNADSLLVRHDLPSGVDKRMEWLFNSALPALVKQEIETPGFLDVFMDMAKDRVKSENKKTRTV